MQTFLPEPSYSNSVNVLDNKRLNKQIVETYQILVALHDPNYGWRNHPAVRMWRGSETGLVVYGHYACQEFYSRNEKNHKLDLLFSTLDDPNYNKLVYPIWYDNDFCLAHQSNLIRKNPTHYKVYWPNTPDNLSYIWPVKERLPISYNGIERIRTILNDWRKKDTQLELEC
jgi:hypothetical protein